MITDRFRLPGLVRRYREEFPDVDEAAVRARFRRVRERYPHLFFAHVEETLLEGARIAQKYDILRSKVV